MLSCPTSILTCRGLYGRSLRVSVRVAVRWSTSSLPHSTLATWHRHRATTFVTGAAGFIGTELVKVLVARRHRVFGLTQSVEAAERVRRAGAVPVMGDLLEPGRGRTRRRLTGSFIFRRTQLSACA